VRSPKHFFTNLPAFSVDFAPMSTCCLRPCCGCADVWAAFAEVKNGENDWGLCRCSNKVSSVHFWFAGLSKMRKNSWPEKIICRV